MKIFTLRLLCLMGILFPLLSNSQTNISGVINTYSIVTGVTNNCSCPSTNCAVVSVSSAAGFTAGDKVLLIQMKGARVDSSNTAAHGSIQSLNDAGNYEFATIASIASNNITLVNPLKETYFSSASPSDSACVQLVRVPVYAGAVNVTGTLTAQAWNGRTGGVLAFEAGGVVTLQANISVDGQGYQAARRQQFAISCGRDTAFYYQSTIWNHSSCTSCGYAYDDSPTRVVTEAAYGGCAPGGNPCFTNRMNTLDSRLAAYRGEGVAANTFKKTFANTNVAWFDKGKGRWGNGGGGGGNHNGGGGGGGNYGSGGFGGNAYNNESASGCPSGTLGARRGYGGASLTPTGSKIFMGGGGGEGHDNGGNGSTGTAGGGIIFITATEINNSGAYTISANGVDQTIVAAGDGSGGGGAGGSILLEVPNFTNAITISANGGKGGDHNNNNCHGTGGGGGGGVISFSVGSAPAGVTTNVSGGANGVQLAPSIDCADVNYGATSGEAGLVQYFGSSSIMNSNTCLLLPVTFESVRAYFEDQSVSVSWRTAKEENASHFEVQRSVDGKEFENIGKVKALGYSANIVDYDLIDGRLPDAQTVYYRIKEVDKNGTFMYSQTVSVKLPYTEAGILSISPNPSNEGEAFDIEFHSHQVGTAELGIFNIMGQEVFSATYNCSKGLNTIDVDVNNLPAGTYFITLSQNENKSVKKFIVRR